MTWAAALAASSDRIETVPPGWQTVAAIAEQTGYSRSQTFKLIAQLMKKGGAECVKIRIKTTHRVLPIPHYRVIECGKKSKSPSKS